MEPRVAKPVSTRVHVRNIGAEVVHMARAILHHKPLLHGDIIAIRGSMFNIRKRVVL